MTTIRIIALAIIGLLGSAIQAFANPTQLLAGVIQGFLLAATAIPAAITGTIAIVAANAIIIGSACGEFTFLTERKNERR